MKVTVDPGSLASLLSKINGLSGKANSFKFQWRIDLLNEYKVKVAAMMGSVSGRGGYPAIEFSGTAITSREHWNALQPMTLFRKLGREYSADAMKDLYSGYSAQTTIWEDTGTTKRSFQVSGNFAGIVSSYAALVEEGGTNDEGHKVAKRPLFGIANYLIRGLIHTACQDPNHPLGKKMRQQFVEFARQNGWGSP